VTFPSNVSSIESEAILLFKSTCAACSDLDRMQGCLLSGEWVGEWVIEHTDKGVSFDCILLLHRVKIVPQHRQRLFLCIQLSRIAFGQRPFLDPLPFSAPGLSRKRFRTALRTNLFLKIRFEPYDSQYPYPPSYSFPRKISVN
jgi:hypothetical protein